MMRRLCSAFIVLVLLTAVTTAGLEAMAQQTTKKAETIPFLKTKVRPLSGTYLVLTDANVRARPATKGRRIGRRAKGERVKVVGRAKGPWLAIRDDAGKDVGFIYQSTLMPIIDGRLTAAVTGSVTGTGKTACRYEIHFDGKSGAEGQAFEFADYEVRWNCSIGGKLVPFETPMFMTEGPYRGTTKRIHQITIDILEMSLSLDEVLSTHMLWDRTKKSVAFDSVTVKQYGRKPGTATVPADDLTAALQGAVRLAATAWNSQLWRAVARKAEKPAN